MAIILSQELQKKCLGVWPKTGRIHQIRIHFSQNRFPVLADKVYRGKKANPKIQEYWNTNKKTCASREKPRIYPSGEREVSS